MDCLLECTCLMFAVTIGAEDFFVSWVVLRLGRVSAALADCYVPTMQFTTGAPLCAAPIPMLTECSL